MQSKTKTITTFSFFSVIVLQLLCFPNPTSSNPQTNLLAYECTLLDQIQYDRVFQASVAVLSANLNATLSDLRQKIDNATRFATAQRPNIYALFQCRDYLSTSDCLSCFSTASSVAQRNCSHDTTFYTIYDGCFLHFRIDSFFQESSDSGNGICDNRTVANRTDFNRTVGTLLTDLTAATPRSGKYFAAAKREGVGGGSAVYGVAQCIHTISKSGCSDCLETAFGNIKGCPPNAGGRAYDIGCFLRYSDTAFFGDQYAMDLTAVLASKGDQSKKAIIIGVGVALFLVIVVLLLLYRWRESRKALKGDVIGATELRGPMNFNYQELKSATKNFSEESKVGEGGFGAVYLGVLKDGKKVAIKKLVIEKSRHIEEDFEKEVKIINNVHHRNLVRLLGCCRKGTEFLLVYEYMANSSLDKYLFGISINPSLTSTSIWQLMACFFACCYQGPLTNMQIVWWDWLFVGLTVILLDQTHGSSFLVYSHRPFKKIMLI